ncbi:MAG: SUF system Fe-S cluster assembly regulator [Candidatus Binatia bacterium]
MLRISKLTDYGIMLLTHMAREPALLTYSAPELAARSSLPLPTVSKLLKTLARKGVLITQRGVKGGFSLARRPEDISVAEIIQVLEGPIALTQCSMHPRGQCGIERLCPVRNQWQQINRVVHEALERLTLAAMTHPFPRKFAIFGTQGQQSEQRREQ